MRIGLYLKYLDEEYQISVFKGIRSEAARLGIDLFCIQGGLTTPGKYIPADGVLVLSSVLYTEEKDSNIPAILSYFGSTPCISIGNRLEGITSIIIRNKSSMEKIMEHLIVFHRYRKFLYIGGPIKHRDNLVRDHVFREALNKYKAEFPELEGTITNGGFREASAIDILKKHIRANPESPLDAIIAANDNMAIGALKVLRTVTDKRWKDCAVTGFDDIPQARLEIPSLTTVRQPLHELGRVAVKTVNSLVSGKKIPDVLHIDSIPIFRSSCGCNSSVMGSPEAASSPNSTGSLETAVSTDIMLSRLQYQNVQSEQYLRNVSAFGQQLTTAGSMSELVSFLQAFLDNNDVHTFFLLLHPMKKPSAPGEINLIYRRFRREERAFTDWSEKTILGEFFAHDFRASETIPSATCIYNLISGSEELGLIVYETDDSTHPHMCSAAIFIANTVKRLMILEDEKERSRMLETEVQLRTKDLVESNKLLESESKRRLEVEAEVLHISEMERLRFSLDLHDDICQRLAGISMFSKSLEKGADLSELSGMINETLHRTRQYAHDSFPVELDNLGLNEAFMSLCRSIQKQTGCVCECTWDVPQGITLNGSQEINLYRIIQEAMHNTIKHAKATRASILVTLMDNELVLRVRDNGTGIPANIAEEKTVKAKKKKHVGIGLKSMEYRAHQIGAHYQFSSSVKTGTEIEIRLPL